MPTSLTELEDAWHTEARAIIRRRLLNKSRRKDRRWRDMVGNNPLRHLDVETHCYLQGGAPKIAKRLILVNQNAAMDRLAMQLFGGIETEPPTTRDKPSR